MGRETEEGGTGDRRPGSLAKAGCRKAENMQVKIDGWHGHVKKAQVRAHIL
jgi:hypothetical protein